MALFLVNTKTDHNHLGDIENVLSIIANGIIRLFNSFTICCLLAF